MDQKRWKQVSEIFEAALKLPKEEVDSYVAKRCASDESLRHEVVLLIAAHQEAGEEKFIDSPVGELAAPLIVDDEEEELRDRLAKGQQVGHYTVLQKIGAGGMGEVYLARDTRLDRTVALKILPNDVATNQRQMMRFKQEARIVSTLNQPNIVTIFEFGEAENLNFIATEYIDGETLRRRMIAGRMKLSEILEIGIQVAAALDAAHEANIIHRDIKPENIMIRRRDHLVKVLDFGLAKLTEHNSALGEATDNEAATAVLLKTVPGSVMGTFHYMSPEQAQGQRMDHRTDIWSTGVVLYEMLAGRPPFSGRTNSHMVVSILESEPAQLSQAAKTPVPSELERIVTKALAKKKEERYQSARDLLIDLNNLKRRLDLKAETERSNPSGFETSDPSRQVETAVNDERVTSISSPRPILWWSWRLVLPAALLAMLALYTSNIWRPGLRKETPSGPSTTVPTTEKELAYWITVQKYRDGKPYEEPRRLAREILFEKDYRVRVNFTNAQAGHLYILNETPNNKEPLSILFPSPTTNAGASFLSANSEIQVPEQSWFRFDAEKGTEKIWLVWSTAAVPELEAVRRFANAKDKGVITDSALNDSARAFIYTKNNSEPTIERDVEQKETKLRTAGNVIIHSISLEHD
jgi:serine/threonine protein kinase